LENFEMKKTLVAVAALVATGAFAEVTLSGNVDQAYASKTVAGVRTSGLYQAVYGSYLTFAGGEDLGSGLKASFKIEQGLGLNNSGNLISSAADATVVGNREAWVDLSGAFGGLRLGNQYTPAFFNMAAIDPNMLNNLKVGYSGTSTIPVVEQANTITYSLPTIVSGLNLSYQKRSATNGTDGQVSAAGTDGGTSIGANYASGALYIGVTSDSINGLNTTTIGATYDLGMVKLGFHNVSRAATASTTNTDQMFAISAPVTDALKVAYTSSNNKQGTAASTRGAQMGAYYSLSKRTNAYIVNGSETSTQKNITAVGISHAF
jgi:predicted porin